MQYKETDFEQLKKKTGEFLENGPLGNIRTKWERICPYKQNTEEFLNGLAKADIRNSLISFLYNMSRGKRIEKVRATEQLIGEWWDFGRPDKAEDRDMLQALTWDCCMLIKDNDYWEWEQMREFGESDTDVVRKVFGRLRTLEGREKQADFLYDYLERGYDLPQKVQIQFEQVVTRLINYPLPNRAEDWSIKNSYQLRYYVRWLQELSAAWYTLPAIAYQHLNKAGIWKDYIIPKISVYQSMSCYEVVSDILYHVENIGNVYKEMMEYMGKDNIDSWKDQSRYDMEYIRKVEPACIETLVIQKGLYYGEALDTFYNSRFAMRLEQGRERYAEMYAERFVEDLENREPELFAKYEHKNQCQQTIATGRNWNVR